MKIGDLVRIKQLGDPKYVGKLAIVVVKGTWSVDVHIIDSNISWEPRIAIEELEAL
jgi:hypothetical protein|tara:strand:+ start:985 stop:1152 length:168 start_codon:yes stop_codon:yes gene_type:complete